MLSSGDVLRLRRLGSTQENKMKAIMLMFDSLNRHMLSAYGCDWTHTPNFQRLKEHSVRFDRSFIGSMPCIPARRELHTGRYNFLHRSWGPLEPFDDSAIEMLFEKGGVYTHLITDHQHYWEDGGATYHNRYCSYDLIRGQEGDRWKGEVALRKTPKEVAYQKQILMHSDQVNRNEIQSENDFPQSHVFEETFRFLRKNHTEDRWFLHVECFDPHEPFMSTDRHQQHYPNLRPGNDWPDYGPVKETPHEIQNMREHYASLLSMCDENLGRLLDFMDEHQMWQDTLLIINTDHGFLLSEHDCWGKTVMPFYNEIALTPFFVWDPRYNIQNVSRKSIVQGIDIPATLLDFFDVALPKDMQGKALTPVITEDKPIREAALFGMFGGSINVTDGRYVYMHGVKTANNEPLFQYTLMPTHMRKRFGVDELLSSELNASFSFTKGLKTLKIKAGVLDDREPYSFSGLPNMTNVIDYQNDFLFDLEKDLYQKHAFENKEIKYRMTSFLIKLMKENDAPSEQFDRLGLPKEAFL